jgi:hypothetical protein
MVAAKLRLNRALVGVEESSARTMPSRWIAGAV